MKRQFLDLGPQPLANGFLSQDFNCKEKFYPLSVGFDEDTHLVSLMNNVPKEQMFNGGYIYSSSQSATLIEHFEHIAKRLQATVGRFGHILEIGCNDGVFLRNFGVGQGIGVEPCTNFANMVRQQGHTVYDKFWSTDLAKHVICQHGHVDVIYSANTFCHIQDIDEAFAAVAHALRYNGVFVFEDPSLLQMIRQNSYDQIYDEHAHIFSILALQKILKKHNLEICGIETLDIHGGSNRIWVVKRGVKTQLDDVLCGSINRNIRAELNDGLHRLDIYKSFSDRVYKSRNELQSLLYVLKSMDKSVIAFGATSKLNTILNYCRIGTGGIKYIIDEMPSKQGKFSPGMHIPIVPLTQECLNDVDYIFLGAWNFKSEIIKKLREEYNYGGGFITHVPRVHIL